MHKHSIPILPMILSFVLLLLFSSSAGAYSVEEEIQKGALSDVPQWYRITHDYAKGIAVHPYPDKDSENLGRVPYQAVFPVFDYIPGTSYGFTEYGELTGFINLDYAEPVGDIYWAELEDEVEKGVCNKNPDRYIITSDYAKGIAIHPSPDKDSATLIRVPEAEEIWVYDYLPGTSYGFASYKSVLGFINLDYARYQPVQNDVNSHMIRTGIMDSHFSPEYGAYANGACHLGVYLYQTERSDGALGAIYEITEPFFNEPEYMFKHICLVGEFYESDGEYYIDEGDNNALIEWGDDFLNIYYSMYDYDGTYIRDSYPGPSWRFETDTPF